MKLLDAVALSGCLASLTMASVLLEKKSTTPSTIAFPIERRLIAPDQSANPKRAPFTLPLVNDRYYTHDVIMTLGTPPQKFRALLDTGSSGILVYSSDADLCKIHKEYCEDNGSYNVKKSSTYKFLNDGMKRTFTTGEKTTGDYATDVLQFNNIKVPNMQMGIMRKTDVSENIFGIGYTVMKNIVEPMVDNTPHENLPSLLVKQKVIESRAFSLWMNDLTSPGGEVLFGGIDTEKYTGDLIPVPFVERVKGMVIDYSVSLKKLQMTNDKGEVNGLPTKSLPVFALLDSGSSQTVLPDDIVDEIYKRLGANLKNPSLPMVKCSLLKSKTTIDFLFGNDLIIKAPLSQFIYPNKASNKDNQKTSAECPLWGIGKTSKLPFNTILLGSSFLSSAYVVFDLDNKEASIAQAKWNPKTSNVRPIKAGAHAVPGMTKTWKGVPEIGKTISGWKYLGCANETEPRTLSEKSYSAPNMTIDACQNFCHNLDYQLAGLEYGQECYCGNKLKNGGAVGSSGCKMPCSGAAEQICGGEDDLSLYEDASYIPVGNVPIVNHFGYFGCYSELPNDRLLPAATTASESMTAESCTLFCRQQSTSYLWSGLEFGRECWCGATLPTAATPVSESSCDMVCSGNKKEYCGGSRMITMYKYIDSA